ncbi:hypothetical protein QBC45DRAFT_133911, partial [Copromyces sp. CBS 386.78]
MSLPTSDALIDTGANGYLFVSRRFAEILKKRLLIEPIYDFPARGVSDYQGKTSQKIDEVIKASLRISSRTTVPDFFIVINMNHDLIIGRKWLDLHDVWIDCKNRRVLFPPEWKPDPDWMRNSSLEVSHGPGLQNPEYQRDADRRDLLIDREEKRRADGKQSGRSALKLTSGCTAASEPILAGQPFPDHRKKDTDPEAENQYDREARQYQKEIEKRILELQAEIPEPRKTVPITPADLKYTRNEHGELGYARPRCLLQNPTAILKRPGPLGKMERNLANLTLLMEMSPDPPPRPRPTEPANGNWGSDAYGTYKLKRDRVGWYKERPVQMCVLNGDLFIRSSKKDNRTI